MPNSFVILRTGACQAPVSMGFSRQEYWSGLPLPSPGDFPRPGIEPTSSALQADSELLSHQGRYLDSISLVKYLQFSSVAVMSDSLRPLESQHAKPPCPSPTPRVYSNSCPSSQWCHPAISSSVIPFSCPQSVPASGSFPTSQLFASGGQSIGVSASASVLPVNTQDWFPLGWTGWISLQSKDGLAGSLKSLLQHHSSKASIFWHSAFFTVQLSHPYMTNGKTIALTRWTFIGKVMSLLFNMLSRLAINFLFYICNYKYFILHHFRK